MRILIDGDACPDKKEIASLASTYQKEMIVFVDYAHLLDDGVYEVRFCEVAKDSVDSAILNEVQKGDLVITQDYGLASFVLMKQALVLHISGKIIYNQNIDELLSYRYISAHQRKTDKHIKGPSARTKGTKEYFLKQLENILKGQV